MPLLYPRFTPRICSVRAGGYTTEGWRVGVRSLYAALSSPLLHPGNNSTARCTWSARARVLARSAPSFTRSVLLYAHSPTAAPSSGSARTVLVNTRKYDIHRRYVAHIFYAFNNQGIERAFLEGRYLHQELIDKGFAKLV